LTSHNRLHYYSQHIELGVNSSTPAQPNVDNYKAQLMPTYVYETISMDTNIEPRRFEVFQRMSDDTLVTDPESGLPVIRVISGGSGILAEGLKKNTIVDKLSPAATACGCGTKSGFHKH
jgi:predicted nucleic acid-binding Zn ribbon protein